MRIWKPASLMVLLVVPLAAQEAAPATATSDRAFLEEAVRNLKLNDAHLASYTCTQTTTFRKRNWLGREVLSKVVSESYQSPFRAVDVPLERDGKPVPPKEINAARKRAQEQIQADETGRRWSNSVEYGYRIGNVFFSVFELIRGSAFSARRVEQLNGRPAVVFDFAPRPGVEPVKPVGGMLSTRVDLLCGTLWIDQEDVIPVKVRAYLMPRGRGEEEVFAEDLVKHRDGKWLMAYSRINTTTHPDCFNDFYIDAITGRSGYEQFLVGEGVLEDITPAKKGGPRKPGRK